MVAVQAFREEVQSFNVWTRCVILLCELAHDLSPPLMS